MDHVLLAALWTAWCTLHSALISVTVTNRLRAGLGDAHRYHRLVFNVVSLVTIVPAWWYGTTVVGPVVLRWSGAFDVLRLFLLGIALLLFVAGARRFDLAQFLGLRQLRSGSSHGALSAAGGLDHGGVLGVTRHPWYLATILILWCARGTLDTAGLVRNVVLTVYVVVGTALEERKLVLEYGDAYREYQKEVSMLVPIRFVAARFRSGRS